MEANHEPMPGTNTWGYLVWLAISSFVALYAHSYLFVIAIVAALVFAGLIARKVVRRSQASWKAILVGSAIGMVLGAVIVIGNHLLSLL